MPAAASLPINPLEQVTQNAGGHTPDVALAERHGIDGARHPLPFAALQLVIFLGHEKGERYLEHVVDFGVVELEAKARLHARQRGNDAIAERGHIEVEIAEGIDEA